MECNLIIPRLPANQIAAPPPPRLRPLPTEPHLWVIKIALLLGNTPSKGTFLVRRGWGATTLIGWQPGYSLFGLQGSGIFPQNTWINAVTTLLDSEVLRRFVVALSLFLIPNRGQNPVSNWYCNIIFPQNACISAGTTLLDIWDQNQRQNNHKPSRLELQSRILKVTDVATVVSHKMHE